jgi:hypothetical protein
MGEHLLWEAVGWGGRGGRGGREWGLWKCMREVKEGWTVRFRRGGEGGRDVLFFGGEGLGQWC